MEKCRICNSDYKKAFKSDQIKSVKHQEKIECNLYMHISDKSSHLNSDSHKNYHNKVWCEDCNKCISDTTRHFQSEFHLRNRQNNSNLDTQFDNNVELIMNDPIQKTDTNSPEKCSNPYIESFYS